MTPSDAFYAPPRLNGPERAMRYARAVADGKITTGKKVRAACRRFLNDLKKVPDDRYPWTYDEHKAGRPVEFMERFLAPTKGNYERMELMPWQCFAICNIFGWVSKETGLRRFREALIYVGSGNGKSTMMSGLSAFLASKDGERGADVALFANSKDQAEIVFGEAKKQIAVGYIRKLLRQTGVDLTDEQLDALVEAAVQALNAETIRVETPTGMSFVTPAVITNDMPETEVSKA